MVRLNLNRFTEGSRDPGHPATGAMGVLDQDFTEHLSLEVGASHKPVAPHARRQAPRVGTEAPETPSPEHLLLQKGLFQDAVDPHPRDAHGYSLSSWGGDEAVGGRRE